MHPTTAYSRPTAIENSRFSWVNEIMEITHILCGWTIKETVREAISQRINEITHNLCGWTMKETVSEAISQRINEITHKLCGWKIKEIGEHTSELQSP